MSDAGPRPRRQFWQTVARLRGLRREYQAMGGRSKARREELKGELGRLTAAVADRTTKTEVGRLPGDVARNKLFDGCNSKAGH